MDIAQEKSELRKRLREERKALAAEYRIRADEAIARKVCAHPAYAAADIVFTYLSVASEVDTRAIIRDAWSRGKTVAIPRVVAGTRLMDWYAIDSFVGMEKSSFGVLEPVANPARRVLPPLRPAPARPAYEECMRMAGMEEPRKAQAGVGVQVQALASGESLHAADEDGLLQALDIGSEVPHATGGNEPPHATAARATRKAEAGVGEPRTIALVPGLSFDAEGFRLGYGAGFYDVFLSSFAGVSIGLCRQAMFSQNPLPRDGFDLPVDVVMGD